MLRDKEVERATEEHEKFLANRKFTKTTSEKIVTIERGRFPMPAYRLFYTTELAMSNTKAKDLIRQGGAYINDIRLINPFQTFELKEGENEITLRTGKKKYLTVFII